MSNYPDGMSRYGLIHVGDVRQGLQTLDAGSVQTCITSPPYWGLRDYGTASWDGGDPECEHTISAKDADGKAVFSERVTRGKRSECLQCGATRVDAQLGLESTPEEYVENMVAVFREVRRVLADDGTLWLNLGDSYWGGKGANGTSKALGNAAERGYAQPRGTLVTPMRPSDGKHEVIKPKDLVGIPWRVAFALQADGWYLRQDIIWAKPNPMPESVRDRCTKSHEYVFLLTKSQRYYYDHEAIKEPITAPQSRITRAGASDEQKVAYRGNAPTNLVRCGTPNDTRNKRDVWTINTKPFKGAHFAVMPEALVEPCILAGSKAGDTVLDPFTGSGTVGVVAKRHGRNFVGTELNPEYAAIAEQRIAGEPENLFGGTNA